MNGKAILSVLLFLIWGSFSGWYYICTIKQACGETQLDTEQQSRSNPISFTSGSSEPQESESFATFKAELLEKLGATNLVKITGLYSLDETTGAENLGLERAKAARNLFPELTDDRFVLSSDLIFDANADQELSKLQFNVLINNETIENTDFGSVIYYSGIDSLENNEGILKFAQLLANNTGIKSIDIIGHTDNTLGDADSYSKSMEVASALKRILVNSGMDETIIFTTGKGSTFPLGDNLTEEGRLSNNRIEVLINY